MQLRETAVLLSGVALPMCVRDAGGAVAIQQQSAAVVEALRVELAQYHAHIRRQNLPTAATRVQP